MQNRWSSSSVARLREELIGKWSGTPPLMMQDRRDRGMTIGVSITTVLCVPRPRVGLNEFCLGRVQFISSECGDVHSIAPVMPLSFEIGKTITFTPTLSSSFVTFNSIESRT